MLEQRFELPKELRTDRTICRTVILTRALVTAAIEGAEASGGMVQAPTAEPMRGAPPSGSLAHAQAQAAIQGEDG